MPGFTKPLVCFVAVILPSLSQAFILYDWNLKHLGRERFGYGHVADVLKDAGLVLFQEVNTGNDARTALTKLRDAMLAIDGNEKKTICMGISKRPTKAKERYAMLWDQAELVQMDEKGAEQECNPRKIGEIELTTANADEIEREPAYIILKDKKSKRIFLAATVHALPNGNGKTPALEIPLIFDAVDKEAKRIFGAKKDEDFKEGIVLIGGDFNMSVERVPFKKATELGFNAALVSGPKTSLARDTRELSKPYDNVFLKVNGGEAQTKNPRVINTYNYFKDLSVWTVYNTISDHCPLRVEVEL